MKRLALPLAIAAWWLAWGLLNTINYRQMSVAGGSPVTWSHLLGTELMSALLWIPITLMALWLAQRWPLGSSRWAGAAAHVAGLTVTVAGRALAVTLFNDQVHWYAEVVPPFDELLLISFYNNFFTYGLITAGAHALYFAKAHREREAQLARAELSVLRAQIQPHFLFNTLNTIAAVVHDEPDTAERMITGLGVLLRRSLDSDGRLFVPLGEELAVVRAYLEIEQVRFADRLSVIWEVEPPVLTAAVPPLLLQPLAENAIRHGLWPRPVPGELRIAAARVGDQLRLEVSDDGLGMAPDATFGIGLTNTTTRLRQLYGERHEFGLTPRDGGGVVTTIGLPYRVLTMEAIGEMRRNDSYAVGR